MPASLAYGLIIDNTAPARSCLETFIATGRTFIEGNAPADQTFIVRYVNRDNVTLEQGFTSKNKDLTDTLDDMYSQGGLADLLDAVYLSAEMVAEHEKTGKGMRENSALVLLTTGANVDSFYRLDQVQAKLREKHIRVYVIGFPKFLESPDGKAETAAVELCKQLAADGRAYFPSSETEAKQAAREILGQMHAQTAGAQK